ncbi:MAG: hypothetical protein LBR81_08675, partial [Prevotellaceae bacterium]|nr:hypothetical protein [Prevotellaceae bacterium]
MRKIILTLSMLSISTLSVFSQAVLVFNGVYSCHLTKEISCYIDFQKNGCYTLEINYMPYKAENIETIQ